MPRRTSTVVGREFGDAVRNIIEQTGMTHRRLASELGWGEAKLSDMVRGKGGVTEAELMQLLGFCRVKPPEIERLVALYRETRELGHLKLPDGPPDQLPTLLTQERLANAITVWSMNLVPGHFQTADYIQAVFEGEARKEAVDYNKLIAAKLERRALFHWSRTFLFYIHEQALRLPVGGPKVMNDQYLHILAMAQRNYITVRVVPVSIGAHAGVSGSFLKLSYDKLEPVVFLEGKNSGLFLEDPKSMTIYDSVLKVLDAQALDQEQSRILINSLLT